MSGGLSNTESIGASAGIKECLSFPTIGTRDRCLVRIQAILTRFAWLLNGLASTSLPGVELACASGQRPRAFDFVRTNRVLSRYRCHCRCRALQQRAYSSIGQSPRLIIGLFLVRTRVGPPPIFRSLRHGGSSRPVNSVSFWSGQGVL
jgi:hypothetical protein